MEEQHPDYTEFDEVSRSKASMSILDHLDDLRSVLLKCFCSLFLGCIIVGMFFQSFADFLNYPLKKALGGNQELIQGLVTTSPMGIFSVLLQVCFLGGIALSFPFILYFISTFILPGLSSSEKKLLIPGCLGVFCLFLVGALFSYFLVLPTSLGISIELNQLFGFQLIWSAPHYYGLVVWMTLGVGLCFEFPVAVLLLVYLNVVSVARWVSWRRHMIVAILIVSALITPSGDPFTLAILAVPMYLLYECSIWFGRIIEARKAQEE